MNSRIVSTILTVCIVAVVTAIVTSVGGMLYADYQVRQVKRADDMANRVLHDMRLVEDGCTPDSFMVVEGFKRQLYVCHGETVVGQVNIKE